MGGAHLLELQQTLITRVSAAMEDLDMEEVRVAQSAASTMVPVEESIPPVPFTSASFGLSSWRSPRLAAQLPHGLRR